MFRCAFELRGAIVPADAFFEWKKVVTDGKQPYVDCPTGWAADGLRGLVGRLPVAGRQVTRSFAIITTAANAEIAELHDRMPVIVVDQEGSQSRSPDLAG